MRQETIIKPIPAKVTVYICDHCNTRYGTPQDAEQCEHRCYEAAAEKRNKDADNKAYRDLMDKYCDRHCRGNCNFWGVVPCGRDYVNGEHVILRARCPLLVEKMEELKKEGASCVQK